MQRHLAGLAEFGVADAQDTGGGITIRLVQREGFADAEPGGRQQAEERTVRHALERAQRDGRGIHQRPHVRVGVEIWGSARPLVGEQRDGRDFRTGVPGPHVLGEAAHDTEPRGGPPRRAPWRLRGPGQRELGGDERGAGLVDEGDEGGQQAAGALELVPERAADLQVLTEQGPKPGHGAPTGQGRASGRSRSVSTLA